MKKVLPFIISVCISLGYSSSVGADYACDHDVRLGIVTGDKTVRILGSSRTLYQINWGQQLFVGGRWIELSPAQQSLLKTYFQDLYTAVPEITLLAKEGVALVTDNITRIYSGLVGENSDSTSELLASMKKVKRRVKEKFGQSGKFHYINPGKLEMPEDIDTSLQAQIESGLSNVSGILSAIGTFDPSTDTQDEFKLRKRARSTCEKLHRINELEAKLNKEIRELEKLNVITTRVKT